MELTLYTETVIDSAHWLDGYEGKCADCHGHSWRVCIWFKGDHEQRDAVGILVDFTTVSKLKEVLDHKILNNVVRKDGQQRTDNPTAENLTVWIYEWLQAVIQNQHIRIKVRIYETAVGKETYCEGGDF